MRSVTIALAISIVACSDTGPEDQPRWVGTYAYFADSARSCVEVGVTYDCQCGAYGHYEGTLTLSGTASAPTGQLEYQACFPGSACAAPVTLSVAPFFGASSINEFGFCAGHCSQGAANNDGGWQHWVDKMAVGQDSLAGAYRRADGSPRGCGADFSRFRATRQ